MVEISIASWPECAREEFDVLQAIYDENVKLRKGINSALPELVVTIFDELGDNPACDVVVQFQDGYPVVSPQICIISRGGLGDKKEYISEIADQKCVALAADRGAAGESYLFDLFEAIKEEVWQVQAGGGYASNSNSKSKVQEAEADDESWPREYMRVYFWTHHSRVKQNNVRDLSLQMNVGGQAYVGKPGIIIGEGPKRVMERWWREVKSWSWKEIQEREPDVFVAKDEKEARQLCKFPPPYEIIPHNAANDKLDIAFLKKTIAEKGLRDGLFKDLIGVG